MSFNTRLSLRLHSHEALFDLQAAIRGVAVSGHGPEALDGELAKTRDRIRHSGRPERRRLISRTLLVKGLEFDHVIVANVDEIDDQYNLYVALSRARETLTILGSSSQILIRESSPYAQEADHVTTQGRSEPELIKYPVTQVPIAAGQQQCARGDSNS